MKAKSLARLMAIIMIDLIVLMPFPLVDALRILHEPNPLVSGSVTEDSATIEWTTDEPATTQLDYGETKELGQTELDPEMVTVHLMTLENLKPFTTYYYQILSVTQEGDYEIDDYRERYYQFKTGIAQDTVPPKITNVSVKSLTDTAATIRWVTDEASSSIIYYAVEGQPLSGKVSSAAMVSTHLTSIPAPKGSRYSFIVSSCDRDGNCANSTMNGFMGGADITPPFLNVSVPLFYHQNRITIEGFTEPFSTVKVYVNGVAKRMLWPDDTGADGIIRFMHVALPEPENKLTFEVTDQVGQVISRDFYVTIDNIPPTLEILEAPGMAVSTQSFQISGRVSESSTIVFDVGLEDQTPPGKVKGLENTSATETVVELSWDELNVSDLDEYAIYRDNMRIATEKSTKYSDKNLKQGDSYVYRVSAVDTHCNEGVMSDSITVDVPGEITAATTYLPVLSSVPLTCEVDVDKIETTGDFTHTITLEEGLNNIRITATDKGGHSVVYKNFTYYDSTVPFIEETNIAQLSPSYIADITITGKASEKVAVVAIVDGVIPSANELVPSGSNVVNLINTALGSNIFGSKTVDSVVLSDDEGHFSMHLALNRDNPITTAEETADMKKGEAWKNNIKLVAIDYAGLRSDAVEQDIFYAMCGGGRYGWSVDLGGLSPGSRFGSDALTPNILNPRLLREGMEVISFPINLTYLGTGKGIIPSTPVFRTFLPNAAEADEWDNDWVIPGGFWSQDKKQGYIQLALNPIIEDSDDVNASETTLSEHRKGDCGLGSEIGCFKGHFMFEVNYKVEKAGGATPVPGQYPAGVVTEDFTQKNCVTIILPIDIPLFEAGDLAPWAENMMEGMVDFMNSTIETIDDILEPLKQIYEIVLTLCLLSMVRDMISTISEKMHCGSSVINALKKAAAVAGGTDDSFDVNVAKAGMCKKVYVPKTAGDKDDPQQKKQDNCMKCQDALDSKFRGRISRQNICDRSTCPSAPTLQKYIKDAQKKKPQTIPTPIEGKLKTKTDVKVGGGGLSCIGVGTSYSSVEKVYADYREYQKKKDANSKKEGDERCTLTHVYDQKCCGQEYMSEWGTACGFGEEGMFSEIEESLCLSARLNNKGTELTVGKETVKCGGMFNALAGFCQPDGNATYEFVNTHVNFAASHTTINQRSKDKQIYFLIEPVTEKETTATSHFKVRMCYMAEGLTISGTQTGYSISQKLDCVSDNPDWDVSDVFGGKGAGGATPDAAAVSPGSAAAGTSSSSTETAGLDCNTISKGTEFRKRLDEYGASVNEAQAIKICEDIKEKMDAEGGDYIVWPSSTFLRSAQCLCFSGIISSLIQIKQIFTSVMGCFQSALTTGGFQSGTCESILSMYICDALIDLIRCYSKKNSGGSSSRPGGGGAGGFMAAISSAGSDVMQSAGGRYGDSPMWQTIFTEKKLMSSICMFAFTGTWDLDLGALIDSGEVLPDVETQVWFPTCKRRFRAADPSTGYASWTYQLAVSAFPGSDIRYRTYLKCSEGFSCDANEGYESGECDCNRMPTTFIDREYTIGELSGTTERFETVDKEVFAQVEGSPVRFDKAYFEYSWTNDQGQTVSDTAECTISQDSVTPPAYCAFSVPLGFRCGISLGQEYFAYFNTMSPPSAIYPTNIQAFIFGDKINVDIDIIQQIPTQHDCASNLDCEFTRYLTSELRNAQGGVLFTSQPQPLATSGQNRFPVTLLTRIKKEDFVKTGGGAPGAGQPPLGFSVSEGYGTIINDLKGTSAATVAFYLAINKSRWALLDITNKGILVPWKDIVVGDSNTITATLTSGISIFLQTNAYSQNYKEIQITYNPQAATPQTASTTDAYCNTHNTLQSADIWTAKFTLWKSWKQGGIWQKSEQIENYNGIEQQTGRSGLPPVSFKVICNDHVETAPGQVAAGFCDLNNFKDTLNVPCWCSQSTRTAARSNAQQPYDCQKSTRAKPQYCINSNCTEMMVCKNNATAAVKDVKLSDGSSQNPSACWCPNKNVKGKIEHCADGKACDYEKGCTDVVFPVPADGTEGPVGPSGATGEIPQIENMGIYHWDDMPVSFPVSGASIDTPPLTTPGIYYVLLAFDNPPENVEWSVTGGKDSVFVKPSGNKWAGYDPLSKDFINPLTINDYFVVATTKESPFGYGLFISIKESVSDTVELKGQLKRDGSVIEEYTVKLNINTHLAGTIRSLSVNLKDFGHTLEERNPSLMGYIEGDNVYMTNAYKFRSWYTLNLEYNDNQPRIAIFSIGTTAISRENAAGANTVLADFSFGNMEDVATDDKDAYIKSLDHPTAGKVFDVYPGSKRPISAKPTSYDLKIEVYKKAPGGGLGAKEQTKEMKLHILPPLTYFSSQSCINSNVNHCNDTLTATKKIFSGWNIWHRLDQPIYSTADKRYKDLCAGGVPCLVYYGKKRDPSVMFPTIPKLEKVQIRDSTSSGPTTTLSAGSSYTYVPGHLYTVTFHTEGYGVVEPFTIEAEGIPSGAATFALNPYTGQDPAARSYSNPYSFFTHNLQTQPSYTQSYGITFKLKKGNTVTDSMAISFNAQGQPPVSAGDSTAPPASGAKPFSLLPRVMSPGMGHITNQFPALLTTDNAANALTAYWELKEWAWTEGHFQQAKQKLIDWFKNYNYVIPRDVTNVQQKKAGSGIYINPVVKINGADTNVYTGLALNKKYPGPDLRYVLNTPIPNSDNQYFSTGYWTGDDITNYELERRSIMVTDGNYPMEVTFVRLSDGDGSYPDYSRWFPLVWWNTYGTVGGAECPACTS